MKQNNTQTDLNYLKTIMVQQPMETPSANVRSRVMAAVQNPQPGERQQPMFAQVGLWMVMTAAILVLLWGAVKPGIVLQWKWHNGDVTTFEVYRAPDHSDEFTLISQIPSLKTDTEYTFVDPKLVPGETYTYRIQAVTSTGQTRFSKVITDQTTSAIPAMIALLVASLCITYLLMNASKFMELFSFLNAKHQTQ